MEDKGDSDPNSAMLLKLFLLSQSLPDGFAYYYIPVYNISNPLQNLKKLSGSKFRPGLKETLR